MFFPNFNVVHLHGACKVGDPEILTLAFLKCGISNVVDKSEDERIRQVITREKEHGIHPFADIDDVDDFTDIND